MRDAGRDRGVISCRVRIFGKSSVPGTRDLESKAYCGQNHPPCGERQIHGLVSKRTQAVVRDETNWDLKNFSWHSCQGGRFRRGHRLLVFDFTPKVPVLQLAEVRDTTHTSVSTPDGRDFVAY